MRGGVVGEVFFTTSLRGGGSRRSFTNSTVLVGGDEGALGGRHSAGGHSPGGTHRGLLSGGALNGKHSDGNIQRGGTPLQWGGTAPKCPPLATGLMLCCQSSALRHGSSFSADAFSKNILLMQNIISNISSWMASNFLSLNPAETEFLLIRPPAQLSKIDNPTLTISSNTTIQPVSSARNLGIIFDSNLSFSDHISYISKSCFSQIHDLRHIRNTLDHKTACTIATSLIQSKLDYCNSLYLSLSLFSMEKSLQMRVFLKLNKDIISR